MKNMTIGENHQGKVEKKETKKVKEKVEITFEEESASWNVALTELILEVDKSYKDSPLKEKYDFLITLEMAQKCI